MTYPRKMLLDVTPQPSVFFVGFDPTLHNFYTVPDGTCAPYDAVFASTLACESVAAARATISRSGLFQRSALGNLSDAWEGPYSLAS